MSPHPALLDVLQLIASVPRNRVAGPPRAPCPVGWRRRGHSRRSGAPQSEERAPRRDGLAAVHARGLGGH
eukprot:1545984-Pyramimonas_sp.AAC.1